MRTILSLSVLVVLSGAAMAQVPLPGGPQVPQRPTVSPYLNLLRGNNPAYLNYYGLVQPQLQAQQQLASLQQQVLGLQNTPSSYYGGTGNELITGKQVGFFTHRGYFMNFGGMGAGLGLTGQQGGATNNTVFQGNFNNQPVAQPNAPNVGNGQFRNNLQNNFNNNNVMPFRR
jgi:hypothetical protein